MRAKISTHLTDLGNRNRVPHKHYQKNLRSELIVKFQSGQVWKYDPSGDFNVESVGPKEL